MWQSNPKRPVSKEEQEAYDLLCESLKPSPRKQRKPKAIVAPTRHAYKQRYEEARKVWFAKEYPASWAAGGYYSKSIPDINTTNGFQNYIQDVLNNLGHMCERVNVVGIYVKGQYRRSGSTVGSSDLHAILIGGRSWKIEIKKGADTLSGSQEKYQQRTLAVGALHSVIYVGNVDLFWDCFDQYIQL